MRTRAVGLGALLATASLCAACGAGRGSAAGNGGSAARPSVSASPSAAMVTAAYDTTVRAGTAHVSLLIRVTPRGRAAVSLRGTGVVRFASRASEMTVGVPTGGTMQVRVLGTTEYLRLPPTAMPAGTKPWVKVDLAALTGSGASGLAQAGSDPMQPMSYLRTVSTVRAVGNATVAGVPTTEYQVLVDLDRAAARYGSAARRSLQAYEQATGRHTLPLRLYLDSRGVVHRLQLTLPVVPSAGSASATETLTDFGAPVTVTAPPANEVTDLTATLKGRLGG